MEVVSIGENNYIVYISLSLTYQIIEAKDKGMGVIFHTGGSSI